MIDADYEFLQEMFHFRKRVNASRNCPCSRLVTTIEANQKWSID